MASGRLPPQNEEAERSILGALLLDEDAIVQVVDNLRGEHFYHDRHKKIYQAIYDLFERREPVDMITVTNELQTMGALEEVGGASYLAELVNSVPTSAHASYYSEIVRECAAKRRLISVAGKISELGFKEESEADELIDQAEQE
ncbi:MAG: DnaB-like helicase N-terminal domain-containing protein, partial [Patescibacteria group bacterium]